MAIDKLKIASAIKLCVLGFYLVYFIGFNTSLNIYLPSSRNSDVSIKENLIGDYCLLIMGGSNVVQGISAQLLSENICPTLNLAITNEMAYFSSYHNWLAKTLKNRKYKYAIYSPSILWAYKSTVNDNPNYIDFPGVPIFAQLKNLTIDTKSIFSLRGDLESYQCNSKFNSYNIKEVDFMNSNVVIAQEISRRLSMLGNVASGNSIYVRVPPVYVKTINQAEIYQRLMGERIRMLKGLGVKVVGTTLVSTDSSLFCDAIHPNAKGREVFSKEIKLP
jgi:hypothetical protein